MANATRWNLPEDKRARITEAAMQEFGTSGFSAASLNVIANQAGIAKGPPVPVLRRQARLLRHRLRARRI